MTNQPTYSIGELAEAAGVTPRTIRYYAAEGLLPPPDTQGKYARYSQDHLERLRLIARLKEAYLPLHEIRQRITGLDLAQVVAMLAEFGAESQRVAEAPGAEEYVSNLIAQQRAARAPQHNVEPQMQAPHAAVQAKAAPSPPPLAAPVAQHAPAAPARQGFFRRLMPQRDTRAVESSQNDVWRRVTLAEGVELHVRQPVEASLGERVQALIEHARELFGSNEE